MYSNFLKANDLDAEEELVIRREIGVNGKSRAFMNDTPVNLDQLRQLSAMLVDLHQQFDTLALGESDFQRRYWMHWRAMPFYYSNTRMYITAGSKYGENIAGITGTKKTVYRGI